MRAVYLVLAIAAVFITCVEAALEPAGSGQSSTDATNIAPVVHGIRDMDKRSLRRTGENRELSKAETANDEERAISWSTLGALVKRKEVTDGDLVRMLIQGEDLAKILKKMGVKYKTVNGIKVYPKYDPEYQRFLQYFRFIDSVPGLKRN